MNWKLILQLSMFGLAMAFATVFVIPSNLEPPLWLVIFIICAYLIAKRVLSKPFFHGLLLGLANCFWIILVHTTFMDQYMVHHPRTAEAIQTMPMSPRMMMLVVGPMIGVASGIVIGLFAMIASWLLKRRQPAIS